MRDERPASKPATPEQGAAYRNLAQEREFVDPDGVTWRRRGGLVADKRLRRLLADEAVRVLHDYLGEVTEVPADGRDRFWDEAEARMRASAYSHFYGAEFKSDEREHLLVIHEDC